VAHATVKPGLPERKGIHHGSGDEALGCYLLKQLPEYKDAEIVRSRDSKVLDTCNIILDVGGTYEPGKPLVFPCNDLETMD
jgi:uncharacterized UPF0160 family protein